MRFASLLNVLILTVFTALLAACVKLPDNIQPVENFQLQKYLGTWYEIARLDHSFEEGLSQVTANYSMRDDGGVKVINRGFSVNENQWEEAEGKAFFVENETTGFLKVSFFGPFYGAYVIFELDHEEYQYSLVAGPDRSYLWLLARQPTVDDSLKERLIAVAQQNGFDTDQLIWVDHNN